MVLLQTNQVHVFHQRLWEDSTENLLLEAKFKFSFFFLIYFFYWRIIALQNFVVFCQTSTLISHRYKYIPSLFNLPPISLPILTLSIDTELLFEFPEPYSKIPVGYLFYILFCKFPCYSFHISHSLLPSPHVHKSILYVCFSTAAL